MASERETRRVNPHEKRQEDELRHYVMDLLHAAGFATETTKGLGKKLFG